MWQHIQRTRIIGLGSKAAGGRDYVLFTEDGWGGDACGELCESGATHDEPGSRGGARCREPPFDQIYLSNMLLYLEHIDRLCDDREFSVCILALFQCFNLTNGQLLIVASFSEAAELSAPHCFWSPLKPLSALLQRREGES